MPLWFRTPKGVVVRDTPNWYAHQRARVSAQSAASLANLEYPAVGLANTAPQSGAGTPAGVNLHVIGIWTAFTAPVSVYGRYIGGVIPPTNGGSGYAGTPAALYSNDPMPPGMSVTGVELAPSFQDPTYIPDFYNPWYPPWEIAVITPGMTWELYGDMIGATLQVMFDYIWLQD